MERHKNEENVYIVEGQASAPCVKLAIVAQALKVPRLRLQGLRETLPAMAKIFQAIALCVCLVLASVSMQGCGCDEDEAQKCIATCAPATLAVPCNQLNCMVECIKDESCCDEDGMKAALASGASIGCSTCD
jgi:hypothetical protein